LAGISIESEFQDIDELVAIDERDASRRQHLENARRKIAQALPQQITGVAALRLRKGWSQEQLAQEMGSSQSHVARIESGQDILLDTAWRLAKALGYRDLVAIDIDPRRSE
jgi:ribosome-binding protein aMBF1 (putative translation factor)